MFEKLKKNSVKFFVFAINILLAVVAVFVIREKDQARLLEKAQKEIFPSENINSNILPSFENSVSADVSEEDSGAENNPDQADASAQSLPVDSSAVAPASPAPTPAVSAPVPVQKTAPANTKTKTS